MGKYPKRLVEVDLPIKRISEHARREKSVRHAHISSLHIWWARRPLAACRAVLCAAAWPDPADPLCPERFREAAKEEMLKWVKAHLKLLSSNSLPRFLNFQKTPELLCDNIQLRKALLDFIADFADWDNSNSREYLSTVRTLTQTAHEVLGGIVGTRPLVVDPFAGGGSIPLESLRIGADSFASDVNPVAVLLNKVLLEYVPRYGNRLADQVKKWGDWIKEQAEKSLAAYYPKDPDGANPIAYLWARTITCEGPNCGSIVPLIRSLWLAKKSNRSVGLKIIPNIPRRKVDFEIIINPNAKNGDNGTVRRGAATCPCCGYTTPVTSVRKQLLERHGGANDAMLVVVVTTKMGQTGRCYRLPNENDILAVENAAKKLKDLEAEHSGALSLVPDETISLNEIRRISIPLYGMLSWGDLFSNRQALALATLYSQIKRVIIKGDSLFEEAVRICLALAVDKQADRDCSLCRWISQNENIGYTFSRQALGMMWDFVEAPFISWGGGWTSIIDDIVLLINNHSVFKHTGTTGCFSATNHALPNDSAHIFFTDPPYYDAVPYAHLSDFFYVWLRRSLANYDNVCLNERLVPKQHEIVVDRPHRLSNSNKDISYYENELKKAFIKSRQILQKHGIGIIVFASKSTASWEAILQAVVDADWIITGSWPIDTEREARIAAQGQARLGSSVHLICRPRYEANNASTLSKVGDWRDVLQELPIRTHEWLPRLAKEGIVGADAIFSCLGPALEIFSKFSKVEKASGEQVSVKEYLEYVWAAVAREALTMIFEGADATGFEEDARLTAMWLWTLSTGANGNGTISAESESTKADEYDEDEKTPIKISGFALEYDAARKIAQGLGVHLDNLTNLVEIKGSDARLLPVSDRAEYLFGTKKEEKKVEKPKAKMGKQLSIADFIGKSLEDSQFSGGTKIALTYGKTTLDRIHQSMLLFGLGESGYLKKLLIEEGAGADPQFWRLAQALSALYPSTTAEKRWIDGVLARKKTLGL